MQRITCKEDFSLLENGNRIMGICPEMNNSSVTFSGKNNILFCSEGVKLANSSINFKADNSIVYLCAGKHDYKLNLTLYNDSVFYSGKDCYFNGVLTVALSERKHFVMGNDCLLSFGIWIRNADPHLIYDADTRERINPTKSIFIGDHVWLGQSAMILKGTEIESGSIIGAMSVVSGKKIPHNSSWAGNPAKKIRDKIFWEGSCVHAWTDEKTKNSMHYDNDCYIYSHTPEEYISFEEIDRKLDAAIPASEKLDFLDSLSENNNKNRFAAVNDEPLKEKSSGFFSRFNKGV
ncbi:MAG: acyltransferase [Clostridia bacterium]|nr:acyltransferase [Clostridia bacterium]